MTVRKSQQKCVNTYIANHYDRINLTVPQGKKNAIQAAAKASNESVNAFINRAIDEAIERLENDNGIAIEK